MQAIRSCFTSFISFVLASSPLSHSPVQLTANKRKRRKKKQNRKRHQAKEKESSAHPIISYIFNNSPMVDMNVVLNASSENRNKMQVLPTPESPINNNLNK